MYNNKIACNEKKESNNKFQKKQHPVKNRVLQQATYYQNNLNHETLLQLHGVIGNQKVGQFLKNLSQTETTQKKENKTKFFDNLNSGLETFSVKSRDNLKRKCISSLPIQRVIDFENKTEYLDIDKNLILISSYQKVQRDAKKKKALLTITEGNPGNDATALYKTRGFTSFFGGVMTVKKLDEKDKKEKSSKEYNDRLINVTHETIHFIDDVDNKLDIRNNKKDLIFSEWRAFAAQSAVVSQLIEQGKKSKIDFSSRYFEDKKGFETFFWDDKSKKENTKKALIYKECMDNFKKSNLPDNQFSLKMYININYPSLKNFEPLSYEGYENLPFVTDVSGHPKDRSNIEDTTYSYINKYKLYNTKPKEFIAKNLKQLKDAIKLKEELEKEPYDLNNKPYIDFLYYLSDLINNLPIKTINKDNDKN